MHLLEQERIVVGGFGGQLQDVIPAALAEEGRLAVGVDLSDGLNDEALAVINDPRTVGIILSGGHDSVHRPGSPQVPQAVLERGVPILGNCYGEQALAHALGGVVMVGDDHEMGRTEITITPNGSQLFDGIPDTTIGLMSHRDVVTGLPDDAVQTAESGLGVAAFEIPEKRIYGVQWHPESAGSVHGRKLLTNFADICGLGHSPEIAESYIGMMLDKSEADIINAAQHGHVSIFLSGGVDSAVAAAHIHKVLTEQGLEESLTITYVDTGTMRYNDRDTIELLQSSGLPIDIRDESELFLDSEIELPPSVAQELGYAKLPKMADAENGDQLRKVYKYGFLQVQDAVAAEIRERRGDPTLTVTFVQGTNAADRAESGTKGTAQIKEHHNSGVEEHVDDLVEPLEALFKGQIRKAGAGLGLPPEVVSRQPFPGPSLGIRVVTQTEVIGPTSDSYQDTKEQLADYMRQADLPKWLYGVQLAPVTARGVRGDEKFDGYAAILQGNQLEPGYWQLANELSIDLGNQITSIGRVGALIGGAITLTDVDTSVGLQRDRETFERLDQSELLKDAWLGMIESYFPGLEKDFISQHFMAAVDHGLGLPGANVPMNWLRLFQSGGVGRKNEDMMTGNALIPGHEGFPDIVGSNFVALRRVIVNAGLASGLVYDLTHKPYGATEWI